MAKAGDEALALDAGSAVTLALARGDLLCVRGGRVWITETGVTGDHVLDAGMCLRASGAGPLVIEAWSDARLALRPAGADAAVPRRLPIIGSFSSLAELPSWPPKPEFPRLPSSLPLALRQRVRAVACSWAARWLRWPLRPAASACSAADKARRPM
ncbi:DUF2917 domain-containing protein [Derxia lacustris]|uniref:DUF2917 domain-containing protein n=1 Tax=Derxia lacustris TaxID=764842 RepID=UPI001F3D3073|nr:DUF2917 domain-containing protein [Derxia lacustris]